MIANVVEMILVNHICNFVKLNAGFLRVNFGFPAEVYHDDTFVSGVDDEYGGEENASSRSKKNGYRLKMKIDSINQTNETWPAHARFLEREPDP